MLNRLVAAQARAIVVFTVLVAALGLVAGASLPSDIYPPLQFPRFVIIAHAGTTPARTMMLTVTRPLEQAMMEVPGIRRVRSTTFRGASRDLRAVRSRHRHGGRGAAGPEPHRRDARPAARGDRSRPPSV